MGANGADRKSDPHSECEPLCFQSNEAEVLKDVEEWVDGLK